VAAPGWALRLRANLAERVRPQRHLLQQRLAAAAQGPRHS